MKLSLEQQPVMVVILAWLAAAAPLLTGCSGCTCSQTLVRAKPLFPSISIKHILSEKDEASGCGSGHEACACGCQSMSGCPGMAGCQQHASSANPLTSQSCLPTSGYNAHPSAHCYYSNSHLYATPPGYISPASTSASTTSFTHYPHYQATYTQPHSTASMQCSATRCVSKSCETTHSEESEEDCSCSRETRRKGSRRRPTSRKSSRRNSSARHRKCKESEEDESAECHRSCKQAFHGCIKLPFFSGSIKIG